MLPLADICKKKHNVYYHLYANDTQLYLPIKMGDNSALQSLCDCFSDITKWMSANFLHLNESKTEVIVFGPSSSTKHIINKLGLFESKVHNQARSLGVTFDAEFKFDKHINSVVRGGLILPIKEYSEIETFFVF